MDQNGWTGGNYPAPNGHGTDETPRPQEKAYQTQYFQPRNNLQTPPAGNQEANIRQNNNYVGAYNNPGQTYPNYQAPQNHGAYQRPRRNKTNSGTMLYVLITVISLCVIVAVALYFVLNMDLGSDKGSKKPTPTVDYESEIATQAPSDVETEPETEEAPTTEAPTTEAPTTETPTEEETEEEHTSHEFLDELNQKYNNYFDFEPNEDGYIIADSGERLLTEQDLHGMTEHQVCMARNEIYARHGYIFQTEKYNEYFENFSWYRPTTTVLPALSSLEVQNVNMIIAYENARGW